MDLEQTIKLYESYINRQQIINQTLNLKLATEEDITKSEAELKIIADLTKTLLKTINFYKKYNNQKN